MGKVMSVRERRIERREMQATFDLHRLIVERRRRGRVSVLMEHEIGTLRGFVTASVWWRYKRRYGKELR